VVRAAFVCLFVVAALLVVNSYAATPGNATATHPPAPPANGTTVIAGQRGHLYGYAPNGSLVFDDHRYGSYWDVDPSPVGGRTVLYAAAEPVAPEQCGGTDCVRNVAGRLNVSTGERTRLFARLVPNRGDEIRWHDVDRVNESHFVVAGIARDRVFVVNATSGLITWQWDAQNHYAVDSGGSYPGDWTHLNDVEVLPGGDIMVSLRNHDQVAFIDRQRGIVENRTLGADGEYGVLYEQHNPDYIPAERGGPAVVVADSQNNRVVEYQRTNGRWTQSWVWRGGRLQWPRDADRLPSGNTLITDSNGDRVLVVDKDGEVVWSVPAELPYEAERLDTGDESAGGRSAATLGLDSRVEPESVAGAAPSWRLWRVLKATAPALPLNAVLYALPRWVGPVNLAPLALAGVAVVGLAGSELFWKRRRIVAGVRERWP
jgi:hypothetical protein